MKIFEILNQNKRGKGYYRSSWGGNRFIQMNYTTGIYILYEVKDKELSKSPFEFTQEDMLADDWGVQHLAELEYTLLSLQEKGA